MDLEDQWIKLYSSYVYTSTTPSAAKHVNAANLSFYRIALWELHLIDMRNISSVKWKCMVYYYDHIWHNQYSSGSCERGLVYICSDGAFS